MHVHYWIRVPACKSAGPEACHYASLPTWTQQVLTWFTIPLCLLDTSLCCMSLCACVYIRVRGKQGERCECVCCEAARRSGPLLQCSTAINTSPPPPPPSLYPWKAGSPSSVGAPGLGFHLKHSAASHTTPGLESEGFNIKYDNLPQTAPGTYLRPLPHSYAHGLLIAPASQSTSAP